MYGIELGDFPLTVPVILSRRLNIPFRENFGGRTVSQGSTGKRTPLQPWAAIKYPRWGMGAQYSGSYCL